MQAPPCMARARRALGARGALARRLGLCAAAACAGVVDAFTPPTNAATSLPTSTATPSASHNAFSGSSILVLRLGDATWNASAVGVGYAVPLYIDEYSTTVAQTLLMTDALPSAASGDGDLPCTLASGATSAWLYDSDGLPSNALDASGVSCGWGAGERASAQ